MPGLVPGIHVFLAAPLFPGAFSSEVETGSRQENASNQESSAFSDLSESEGIPFWVKS
jgi:hypothetical protein